MLRFTSARADAVLAMLERADPGAPDPGLEIVRADALAALGRMDDARAAYRRALALVSSPRIP